ncbi:MAG: hypothetical protein ACRDRU_01300, partial [Pseudonocardiaceae bacterium]
RAGRIVDLNARLQSAKAARDQENAQISYSVDQAYRSYDEYAAQIRLDGGSPMDPEAYGQLVRSEEKENRTALDEAVIAAERDLNQAFEGYSVLRIEVDGQPLWLKLVSLGPYESGLAVILRGLDQQAETTRQGILTWGVDASPQDKIVLLASPPYSSVRALISGDPTLQTLLPDSTLTAGMWGVIAGAAASIGETEAYRKEVDKRLRWVVVPAGFLSGPLGWAFSIGIGVDATIAEIEGYSGKVAQAEAFQRAAEIGVITQSDLGDWNQPPSAWGVVFAVGGSVLDVVVPVAAGRVARALGPADDAARALRAADALDPADTSAASVLRGLDAPPVTPGGALAREGDVLIPRHPPADQGGSRGIQRVDDSSTSGVGKSGDTPSGSGDLLTGTVPARPGDKPPTDPHDVEAWNKYYEENPNAPRSVGAAAADDPAVFGGGSGPGRLQRAEDIHGELAQPGALAQTARSIHDLAPTNHPSFSRPRLGDDQIARTQSTIALAEVKLPSGRREIWGSAGGRQLDPHQRAELERLGIRIISGNKHGELNIIEALPEGSSVNRWGISWGGGQRGIPCTECAPEVRRVGGILEE